MFTVDSQLIWGVAIGIAVMIVGYGLWKSGGPITLATATEAGLEIADLASKIRDVADEVVGGMQQLKETGKIDTGSEAYEKALTHLEEWFPDLHPDQLEPFIENAYRKIKPRQQEQTQPSTATTVLIPGGDKTSDSALLDKWNEEQGKV